MNRRALFPAICGNERTGTANFRKPSGGLLITPRRVARSSNWGMAATSGQPMGTTSVTDEIQDTH